MSGDREGFVMRRSFGLVVVATALVALFLLALVLALAQGKLPVLALDFTEHLFGIVLAVFVFERMLAWREGRQWLAAKDWLYLILLETVDDLLKGLLTGTPRKWDRKDTWSWPKRLCPTLGHRSGIRSDPRPG